MDGGAHLLLLDMVSDTLNAKAAIYAIQEGHTWCEVAKIGNKPLDIW